MSGRKYNRNKTKKRSYRKSRKTFKRTKGTSKKFNKRSYKKSRGTSKKIKNKSRKKKKISDKEIQDGGAMAVGRSLGSAVRAGVGRGASGLATGLGWARDAITGLGNRQGGRLNQEAYDRHQRAVGLASGAAQP